MNGKKPLWCRLGFHLWGPWVWDRRIIIPEGPPAPVQHRACKDCLQEQGPLISSEQRRYYESWRDR